PVRYFPDVGLPADATFVVYNNGTSSFFGGTSCAAPLWTGFTAMATQQVTASGSSAVGFLNPALYTLGTGTNYTNCFHDIVTGNNIGTNSIGYSAVTGYDLCTGWGSPNGAGLIDALAPRPYIRVPPTNQPVVVGSNATFSVVAVG